jgi:hypothetical protein
VVDDGHRLTQVLDQVELVAGEQHAAARASPLHQDLADGVDAGRIQAGQGLVEHQRLRVVHERGRQLHSLLVAVRQRPDLAGCPVPHRKASEPPGSGGGGRGRVHPVQPADVLDLLGREHVRIQDPFLRHVAEAAPFGGPDRGTVPPHRAAVKIGQAEDGPHGGGLAGAIRAEEPHHLPRRDAEAQVVESRHVAEPTAQVVEL